MVWSRLRRSLEQASTIIHREQARAYLNGDADPTDIAYGEAPPFQMLLDILEFYRGYRNLEYKMTTHFPLDTNITGVFSEEMYLGPPKTITKSCSRPH